jgi:hypothetical protein
MDIRTQLRGYWEQQRFRGILIAAAGLPFAVLGFLLYLVGLRQLGWLLVLVAFGFWLTGFISQFVFILRRFVSSK